MTATIGGALSPVRIDGHWLDRAVDNQRDVVWDEAAEHVQMARPRRREARAYQGAGYPLVGGLFTVTLRFDNIRRQYDLIEKLFAVPGPHEIVLWHRIHMAYAGDGDRTTFYLPRVPLLVSQASFADFPAAFPEGVQTALEVEAAIGLGDDETALTVQQKTQVEYDAGTPSAGQAWFVPEAEEFKVGTAPESGERLYVTLTPILQMFHAPQVSKSYQGGMPRREPRSIVLLEQ